MTSVERQPHVSSPAVSRLGIVAKTRLHPAAGLLAEIAGWLEARGVTAIFETDTASLAGLPAGRPVLSKDDLPKAVDMVLVLGGDGSLLGMADRIAEAGADIPILGVNFGSLGFLTEIILPELYPSLEAALTGNAPIDERLMLRSRTWRGDRMLAERLVLNDVVVTKGALSRIIDLSVSVGGQFVTRFKADGLIIASPTGSTAYNLATGGPIVHPAVDAIVLTPIAPHTLTNRPLVIPGSSEIRVEPLVDGQNPEIYVTFDGQSAFPLEPQDVITVSRAPRALKLVRAATRTYFEILREKLKWGER
jgi:NAD+ kinase